MIFAVFKVVLAAFIIVFTSWLSGKRPELAGFITALPLISILAIAYSYIDYQSIEISAKYAKSIIVAVPLSLLFFVPFFFADRIGPNFWVIYAMGFVLLAIGYLIHSFIMKFL